jgi:hypothetical protein
MADSDIFPRNKFLVDDNLGRLAKWLRLLGFDTGFYAAVSLPVLSRLANKEGRIFLTRSKKNAGLKIFDKSLLIKSSGIFEQLRELSPLLVFSPEKMFTRCSLCNNKLVDIEKERVTGLVPEYVYQNQQRFNICRKCGKIYWQGTHNREILQIAKDIFSQDKT